MKKQIYPGWDLIEYVNSNRRLDLISNGLWECLADPPGAMHRWFCPQMFEQLCVMDPHLEKMIKNYDGSESQKKKISQYLVDVCLRQYLQIIANKAKKLAPQMVDYFDALYRTKNWEEDKKEYAKLPNNGIELSEVQVDRFII